jgi:hypothetical protein
MASEDGKAGADEIDAALQRALGKTGSTNVPPQIYEVTQRHVVRLSALVQQLRAAGIDESVVRHSTKKLLASYEAELLNVLIDLAGDDTQ